MERFLKFRHILTAILSVSLFMTEAAGGPVYNTHASYRQPDGSVFSVMISGDEWLRIRRTEDGCAIIKDSDGWWCYAIYDENGQISSTGCRVGEQIPAETARASRNIPYGSLAGRAALIRSQVQDERERLLESTRQSVTLTKSGSEEIEKRALALLVEFNDIQFQYSKEDFEKLLNEPGYNGTGSAKEYFEDQFGEGWNFTFDVSDIITLDWPAKHYGENNSDDTDIRPWDMVEEACRAADKNMNIDFSLYDQDEDGYVDNVYIFYAGKSESEHTDQTDLIWPHQYYIFSGTPRINLVLDGKRIDRYACSAEIAGTRSLTGIGQFCHEFGHTLGLVDLYDTDYDEAGGWAAGVWKSTSLMDGGNYNNNSATPPNFNCIERELLGLSEPVLIEQDHCYELNPIHKDGKFFRLDSGTEGEYYLFECRSNEGWDEYIGGKGMLVYHIDKNAKDIIGGIEHTRWKANTVNADHSIQCADLIEADGRSDLINSYEDFTQSIRGIFFPQDNVTALTPDGVPALSYRYSDGPGIAITGIQTDGETISFNTVHSSSLVDIPAVTDVAFTAFPDAAIITFCKNDIELEGEPVVEWRRSGSDDKYSSVETIEYSKGKYACKIEGLESGNITYEAHMRFYAEGSIGKSYRLSFMTKRKPAVQWPYIYISGNMKAGEGIALHVVNAKGLVTWQYNGKEISSAKDFHFYPTADGTLQAQVQREDGSMDTIIKEIVLTQ